MNTGPGCVIAENLSWTPLAMSKEDAKEIVRSKPLLSPPNCSALSIKLVPRNLPLATGCSIEFFLIKFYRIYRICGILFLVILKI